MSDTPEKLGDYVVRIYADEYTFESLSQIDSIASEFEGYAEDSVMYGRATYEVRFGGVSTNFELISRCGFFRKAISSFKK